VPPVGAGEPQTVRRLRAGQGSWPGRSRNWPVRSVRAAQRPPGPGRCNPVVGRARRSDRRLDHPRRWPG